ncbi:MAG: extracellular solute-binding protein, partial [Clostridiales bacterium]|nr:extracellular solute-binding protein [Clostridiales bacterium]
MAIKRASTLLVLVMLIVQALGVAMPGAQAGGEATEFSVFLMSTAPSTQDPAVSPVGLKLTEMTGVKLNLEFLVGTDVRQKASLMIASGELPDMIVTGDSLGDFISAGALVPLNDYIAGAKNIDLVYTPVMIKLMTQPDGNIYNLSTSMPSEDKVYPAAGFYLSMDLLKENGYPVVRSLDEYKQLLIDYVKAHPEIDGQPTIGFTGPMEGWRASGMQYGASRFLGGYPNDGLTYVDPDTLEAKIIMRAPFEKAFYQFLNDLNAEGILDKEMFMQTNDQYNAKIASGRVVGLYDQRSMFIDAITALEKIAPERMLVAMPVVLDGVKTEKYRGPRVFTASGGLSITT